MRYFFTALFFVPIAGESLNALVQRRSWRAQTPNPLSFQSRLTKAQHAFLKRLFCLPVAQHDLAAVSVVTMANVPPATIKMRF